jgi:uncharacterized protein (DUF2062 family)
MARKLFKRFMPRPETVREHKSLQVIAHWLHDPNLFHLNRYSVSTAFLIGLFWALIPVPFQMVFAATFAIWWRANLPISVALVWITNPLTMPPIFFATYKFGTLLLGRTPSGSHHQSFAGWVGQKENLCDELGLFDCGMAWMHWLASGFDQLWQPFLKPFLLGSLVAAIAAGLLSFVLVRVFWRVQVTLRWRSRLRDRETAGSDRS